jgi:hypothetical protein
VTASELLAELGSMRTLVEAGADVDVPACESLIGRVNQHASSASRSELEALQENVRLLTVAVTARMQEIDDKLGRIREGRRGVQGYARLRSHSTAQRLRKRV